MVFECLICNYKTSVKCNYQKHLSTNKHFLAQKKEEESIKKEENCKNKIENNTENIIYKNNLNCQWCRRLFTRKDNFQRHIMICKQKNENLAPENSLRLLNREQKESKSIILHQCKYCFVNCSKQSNLNRHYKTCQIFKFEQNKLNIEKLKLEKEKELVTKKYWCQQVSTSDPSFICLYCNNKYLSSRSLNKHMFSCGKRKLEIHKIENEKNLLKAENEKEKAINKEKELRIKEQNKTIEIAKQSTIVNIHNTQNKTINFLNTQYYDMIAMETFLKALENTHQLTLQERQDLLNAYYECGIDVFARNFSYIMKQNCKRQLEAQGLKDMKLLPLFCSDGNLRSHKEKQLDGRKTLYDNQSINRMLNISNQQIHQSYQKLVPISGKERNRIYNEIKKDNHQN